MPLIHAVSVAWPRGIGQVGVTRQLPLLQEPRHLLPSISSRHAAILAEEGTANKVGFRRRLPINRVFDIMHDELDRFKLSPIPSLAIQSITNEYDRLSWNSH